MRSCRPATRYLTSLISALLCFALLASPAASALQGGGGGRGSRANGNPPTKGAPGRNLPNLDEVRRRGPADPKAQPPVPSKHKKCPPDDPNCEARHRRESAREANPVPAALPTAAKTFLGSLLGPALAAVNNPYEGVLLASASRALPLPPASRGAATQNPPPSTGWLSSPAGLFGGLSAPLSSPDGFLDYAGCSAVGGWAWDPAQPVTPVVVALYADGHFVATALADQYRADLAAAGKGDGRHGYSFPLPDSLRDGAQHDLSVQIQGTGFTLNGSRSIAPCEAPNYDGEIIEASCDQITGKAWDAGRPSTPIDVDVYVDETFRARASADVYNASLDMGDNRHQFSVPTPLAARDGQMHTITIRPARSGRSLGSGKSVTCNGPAYTGFLDGANCTYVYGWAWDSRQPDAPVSVDLYADGRLVTTALADTFRPDLAGAGIGDGRHGYQIAFPDALRDGSSHDFLVKVSGGPQLYGTTSMACAAQATCSPAQSLATTEFVKDFYMGALARQPRPVELQYWNDALRTAAAQGQTALLAKARELGRELFREGEYAKRGRMAAGHEDWYVADLYWGYLQRGPDASGQSHWAGETAQQNAAGQNGWLNTLGAFESSGEFSTRVAALCPSPADSIRSYDAALDFSPLQNADGAWSYGYRAAGGGFTLYAASDPGAGKWYNPASPDTSSHTPFVSRSAGAQLLYLHPGPSGEQTVVRWTAPAAGKFQVVGRFENMDNATADVHVLHNGTSVLDGYVNGAGSVVPFSLTRDVQPGDTLEFPAGAGGNGTAYDSTGLAATIFPAQTLPYNGAAAGVPGKIEAELYDSGGEGVAYHDTTTGTHGEDYDNPPNYPPPAFRQGTDVDIYKSVGYSNGYSVVMAAGDWMNYTVEVSQGGSYTLSAQTWYWGTPGGTFHVEADGADVTGPLQVPGGSAWRTVAKSGVRLGAGRHVLRVACDSNGSGGSDLGHIDYLRLTPDADAGLVAHWKFDEAAGATATDSTGNGNTGTLQSGVTRAAGKVGTGALDFNGTSGYVGVASNSSITSVADNFTVAFWASPRSPHEIDPEGTAGGWGVSGQRYVIAPLHGTPNEAGAGVSVGTNGVSVYEHSDGYMPAVAVYQGAISGWAHVAVVYQNRQPKIYVNGQLVRTGQTSPRSAVRIDPYWIGGMVYGYFDGQLDDVRLYNRPLSAAEVGALAGTQGGAGGADPTGNNFAEARKDPANETGAGGDDPLSRNFNFSVPLVGLKGRAGLDLGLSLAYNSLVWTKDATTGAVKFDADDGDPSPGFRLGTPVVQGPYRNGRGENAYLLVIPSGGRVELRQVGTSNTYEATDSSYARLTEEAAGGLTLRPADGSQLSFSALGGAYKCTRIKDRNGNFISFSYNAAGDVASVTDTLGRVVTFTYDGNGRPLAVEQNRGGRVHQWATFGYADLTMQAGFAQGVSVLGPANGTAISVLNRVSLDDGSFYAFAYNAWGQVYRAERHAPDGRLLSYTEYDLQNPAPSQTNNGTDCPRFTKRSDYVRDWNNDTPALTTYGVDQSGAQQIDTPDGVRQRVVYGAVNTWRRGLVTAVETSSPNPQTGQYELRRRAETTWTQDDESLSYPLNPRVRVSEVSDPEGNHTGTSYEYTSYGLVTEAREWGGAESNVLRRTHTEYNLDPAYVSRRAIGLVSSVSVYDEGGHIASKVDYTYDQGGEYLRHQGEPVQHDGAGYGATFVVGRGLVTGVRRWDVTALSDISKSVESRTGYNTTGSPVFSRDPLGHTSTVSYADRFTDRGGTNTLAYPTLLTDADGFSSGVEYGFDTGLVSRAEDPKGAQQTFTYDAAGRAVRVERSGPGALEGQVVDGGYERWVYSEAMDAVQSWTRADAGQAEACTITVVDGAGRARSTASDFPGSVGGYRAVYTTYDVAGRVSARTNPVEINGLWSPVGDDAAGWHWTHQTYDWKGRPAVTTNPDGTQRSASYGGCGCAGGEVVTLTDEVGRRQKAYSDALGRPWKAEVLNWDGSVYSATTTKYNALDQAVRVRQYAGAAPVQEPEGEGAGYQTTAMTYDGYGRLRSRHMPGQDAGRNTVYTYNADDTTESVTDARGAKAVYGYNARHLVSSVTYDLSGVAAGQVVQSAPNVTFTYDAAGNRTQMADGLGTATYQYDALSRLISETRAFNGVGSFTLSYSYNLAGAVESVTDSLGAQVNYALDPAGRLTGVTGSGFGSVSQLASDLKYRAWGALKHITYGNGVQMDTSYNGRLLPTRSELTGMTGASGNPVIMGGQYEYYPDGRVRYAGDLADAKFDRSHSYDHAGRMTSALTGAEARGEVIPPGVTPNSPYRQGYTYDVWGNMTRREGRFWYQQSSYQTTYANDRDAQNTYDAAGNVLADGKLHTYDAAGRQVKATDLDPGYPAGEGVEYFTIEQSYDGDGQRALRVDWRHTGQADGTVTTVEKERTYFLHSAALGGAVVAEVGDNGAGGYKKRGWVYANGGVLVEHTPVNSAAPVVWHHSSPVTGSWVERGVNLSGASTAAVRKEMDPLGQEVGDSDPFAGNPEANYLSMKDGENERLYEQGGDPFDPKGGCSLDGLPMLCSDLAHRLDGGSAMAGYYKGVNWHTLDVPLTGLGELPTHVYKPANEFRAYDDEGHLTDYQFWPAEWLEIAAGPGFDLGMIFRQGWHPGGPQDTKRRTANACVQMADIAQGEANQALAASHGDLKEALRRFDEGFSERYIGHPLRSWGDAVDLKNSIKGSTIPNYYRGSTGFKGKYVDNQWMRYNKSDQTHHFAAHFSAGINGQEFISNLHQLGDLLQANTGDQDLSAAAFWMGWNLKHDPNRLRYIGRIIFRKICDSNQYNATYR